MAEPHHIGTLGLELRLLLAALAEGMSVQEAAERLRISRRTAQRRLGEARRALGARTNASAVALGMQTASESSTALSAREWDVLALVADGLTSKEIALRLGIAPSTVDSVARSAMAKTNSKTRLQAAAVAIRSTRRLAQIEDVRRGTSA